MAIKSNHSFTDMLHELEEISRWFQKDEIDLDKGLQKLKKGKELIAACKERLSQVENELIEIQGNGREDLEKDMLDGPEDTEILENSTTPKDELAELLGESSEDGMNDDAPSPDDDIPF